MTVTTYMYTFWMLPIVAALFIILVGWYEGHEDRTIFKRSTLVLLLGVACTHTTLLANLF